MNPNQRLHWLTAVTSLTLAAPASAALLLTDNFTATSNERAGALDHNIANRQGGSLATTDYTTGIGVNPNVQLGNTTTLRTGGDGNYLLLAFNGRASLNQNFNGALSAGGLEITFDVSANFRTANQTNWTAINIGMSQADQTTTVNGTPEHFGFLFRGNGGTQGFDGSSVLAGSEVSWSTIAEGGADNFDSIRVLFTDPTDDNPFDGVGETKIEIFSALISGGTSPIYTHTKTGGGYADNYINFTSNDIGGIDNLSIRQIPEPSASVLLMGAAGLLLRRKRNR
jgi:hypothetical protein